jgi:hypothetical protein
MAAETPAEANDHATWAWDRIVAQIRHQLWEVARSANDLALHEADPHRGVLARAIHCHALEVHGISRRLYLNAKYRPELGTSPEAPSADPQPADGGHGWPSRS